MIVQLLYHCILILMLFLVKKNGGLSRLACLYFGLEHYLFRSMKDAKLIVLPWSLPLSHVLKSPGSFFGRCLGITSLKNSHILFGFPFGQPTAGLFGFLVLEQGGQIGAFPLVLSVGNIELGYFWAAEVVGGRTIPPAKIGAAKLRRLRITFGFTFLVEHSFQFLLDGVGLRWG